MRERAAAVGGWLTAGPRDGGGFQVLAELLANSPVCISAGRPSARDGTTKDPAPCASSPVMVRPRFSPMRSGTPATAPSAPAAAPFAGGDYRRAAAAG